MACGRAAALEMTAFSGAFRLAPSAAALADSSAWKCVGTAKNPVMCWLPSLASTSSGSNRSMISA